MKIRSVTFNNRKNEFALITRTGVKYSFPYSEADPRPSADDRIEEIFVDKELGNEAFTYILESGKEGSVHIEQVLEEWKFNNFVIYGEVIFLLFKLSQEEYSYSTRRLRSFKQEEKDASG